MINGFNKHLPATRSEKLKSLLSPPGLLMNGSKRLRRSFGRPETSSASRPSWCLTSHDRPRKALRQRPRPSGRNNMHLRRGDMQGRGASARYSTCLLPVLNCTYQHCAELTGPASKQMAGPTPTLCDCRGVPTVSAVFAALLCVLFALPWRRCGASKENQSQAKSCKPCKIVQTCAPPSWALAVFFRGTRPLC